MTTAFVDTSAWAKRYVPEPESEQFDAWFAASAPITVSALGQVELASVLQKMARSGRLGFTGIDGVRALVNRDISAGFVAIQPWPPNAFDVACGLVALHSQFGLRSLDALQLACAQAVACRQFATADRKLALAARASGFEVLWFGAGQL